MQIPISYRSPGALSLILCHFGLNGFGSFILKSTESSEQNAFCPSTDFLFRYCQSIYGTEKNYTQINEDISHTLTTSKLDRSSTAIQIHVLIVFSSALKTDWLCRPVVYCLRNAKPHNKWIGLKPAGLLSHILFQIIEHTSGVTSKRFLKRLIFTLIVSEAFLPVYLLPSERNVFQEISLELTEIAKKSLVCRKESASSVSSQFLGGSIVLFV